MKWNQFKDLNRCFENAIETFEDVLYNDSSLTDEDIKERLDHFKYKIKNEEYLDFFEKVEDLDNIKPLHSCYVEPEKLNPYGAIVLFQNKFKERIVLDGNHRYNTLMNFELNIKAYVIIIDL